MKKFLLSAIILLATGSAFSQNIRLNAYGMYTFDDKVDSYYSNTAYFEGKIKGGLTWGGGLEFLVKPEYGIELMYLRMDTEAPIQYYSITGLKNTTLDVAMNSIMIGGVRYLKANPRVEPYAGLMMGVGWVDTKTQNNAESENVTKFAWGFRLGANLWASDRIGLKLQTMLYSMPQAIGGGVYFGTGGAGAGVSSYSSLLQFSLGGGLTFKLGGNK
jgi:hypothetical protein